MAQLSRKAIRQAEQLAEHFGSLGRDDARNKLRAAIAEAALRADDSELVTRSHPASYRQLAPLGFRWFKLHRYWFAVAATPAGNIIANLVYETADIPTRVTET